MKTSQHPVLDAIAAVTSTLREQAGEAERLRRLPDDTAKLLRDVGVMRLLQPTRYGGFEENPRIFYEAVMAIAAECGSAGWVAGVVGVHPWQVAVFDDRAQREVWGKDPDTWVSSSYLPTGTVTAVDGGYRITGRWHFSSGADHGDWVILGGMVEDPDAPQFLNLLLPRSDYVIEDVWNVAGLSGSGSNDIVVDDAFVPTYRTVDSFALTANVVDRDLVPGLVTNDGPLYRMPFAVVFADCIAAAIVGMAEGALRLHIDYQRDRVRPILGSAAENPFALATIAESTWKVSVGRLQLLDDVDDMYSLALQGAHVPLDLRYRARLNQIEFCALAVAAIDELFVQAGGGALRLSQPLQRFWRDLRAARNHAICIQDQVLVPYGRMALGHETAGLYA